MLPIKHSVLIVENNQTLFIVDNNENKSTIEQILETPISTDDDPKIKWVKYFKSLDSVNLSWIVEKNNHQILRMTLNKLKKRISIILR